MSHVLVTGGAGFVGAAVVAALLDDGQQVRVLDLLPLDLHPRGWPAHLDARAERVVGDVRDQPAGVLDGVDVVSHQAAVVGHGVDLQDLPHYVSTNDLGTATLLAAMGRAGVGRLVLASSMVVYAEGRYQCPEHGLVAPGPRREQALAAGDFEPPCLRCSRALAWAVVPEDAPLDPRSTYAATKVAQEHLAASWARLSGGSAVALRYHNVYGPWMPKDTRTPGWRRSGGRPWHGANGRCRPRTVGSQPSEPLRRHRRPPWRTPPSRSGRRTEPAGVQAPPPPSRACRRTPAQATPRAQRAGRVPLLLDDASRRAAGPGSPAARGAGRGVRHLLTQAARHPRLAGHRQHRQPLGHADRPQVVLLSRGPTRLG